MAYKKLLRSSHDLHDIYDVQNIRSEIVVDKLSTGLLLRKFVFIFYNLYLSASSLANVNSNLRVVGPSIEAVDFAVKSMKEFQYNTHEMCESVSVKSRK